MEKLCNFASEIKWDEKRAFRPLILYPRGLNARGGRPDAGVRSSP